VVEDKPNGSRATKRTKRQVAPPPPLERLDDDWFDIPAVPWSEPLIKDEPSKPALA